MSEPQQAKLIMAVKCYSPYTVHKLSLTRRLPAPLNQTVCDFEHKARNFIASIVVRFAECESCYEETER